jgi:hypothetical protein
MKREEETLYQIITEADDAGKIKTFFDLLKVITLEELSRLVEHPVDDIIRWAMNPGTMPAEVAWKFAGYSELNTFTVEEIFGLEKHPVYDEFEKYKVRVENSAYSKLEQLVAMAEDVKEAFEGAVDVTITFKNQKRPPENRKA